MSEKLALLVDGDNIGSQHEKAIWNEASRLGDIAVARVYLNAQKPGNWHNQNSYRLIHAGDGKNAADMLLCIQAMDLFFNDTYRRFAIASSDGDFSHLAIRLRELGCDVLGLGEGKAPQKFRQSCKRFVALGGLQPCQKTPPTKKGAATTPPQGSLSERDQKIRSVIAAHSKHGQGMTLQAFGSTISKSHQIKKTDLKEANWRKYFDARPALYEVHMHGGQNFVRSLPSGFHDGSTV